MSDDSPDASDGRDTIAVALVIDDAGLRSRVLHALDCSDGRFVVAPRLESADILIADHLAESDVMEAGLPAMVLGDRSTIDDAVRRGYAGGVDLWHPRLSAAQ